MQPARERLAPLRDSSHRRRETFIGRWRSFISVDELVANGFYYRGVQDEVQCVYCGGIIRGWESGDTVEGEHRKHFPTCLFLNKPMKYPQYKDEVDRLGTYHVWPEQLKQQPRQLAKSGLVYLGGGDKTQCFWCSGILKEWEKDDDPVLEHIKWFPDCPYMTIMKGKDFIEAVRQVQVPRQTALEESPVETVLSMGFSRLQIQTALENLDTERRHPFDCDELLRAILEIEEVGPDVESVPLGPPEGRSEAGALPAPREAWVMGPSGSFSETAHHGEIPQESNNIALEYSKDVDVKALTKQNYEMKKRTVCKVCLEEDMSVVFLPCGHLVCCYSCGYIVTSCPVCRANIQRIVRIFW